MNSEPKSISVNFLRQFKSEEDTNSYNYLEYTSRYSKKRYYIICIKI